MADSDAPGRRAELAYRFWWVNLVIGAVFLGLAASWFADRDRGGWAIFAGLWTLLGVGQVVMGLLNRHEGRRHRGPSGGTG